MRNFFRYIFPTIAIAAAIAGMDCRAETVSQKEAKALAAKFFNAARGQVMAEPKLVYNGRKLTTGSYFAPFYVYNHPTGGFVIISAENKAFPILAYSLTDTFSPDNMGEKRKAMLSLYAKHIENIRYDSQTPYEAIEAWQNIPVYINDLLRARYSATDPITTPDEAISELIVTAESDNSPASASATYSSDQWTQMITDELMQKKDLPLGIVADDEIMATIVYGHKGDYFRIEMDERDKSLWRLLPTEILSGGQLAVFGNPPVIEETIIEEEPFTFWRNMLRENEEEQRAYRAAIENSIIREEPIVLWHGSGHYTVTLPEQVISMRAYSLDGSMVQRDAFRDTNVANIDLTRNPTGFYFAVFFGISGKAYPVKLFR